MARFFTPDVRRPTGPGPERDARSELFQLVVTHFLVPGALRAPGGERSERFVALVRKLAVDDPEWTAGLIGWLRSQRPMRTVSHVAAAEYVKARTEGPAADGPPGRSVVGSVLRRADEPGELLAYWMARHGRALPKPLKRGLADAVTRLWNGRALLEYDDATSGFRFGDILSLVHAVPDPAKPWQRELFRYAVERRHRPDTARPPAAVKDLAAHHALLALPVAARRAAVLEPGAVTRLAALGLGAEEIVRLLQGAVDAAVWEALVPVMEPMALVDQLCTFDRGGLGEAAARGIAERIADPARVARAGALPLHYLGVYQQTPSLHWSHALEQALGHALALVPRLPGRTLVLVDRSASMWSMLMDGSRLTKADAAAVFGIAVAMRAERADLVQFGSSSAVVRFRPGEPVLVVLERFVSMGGTHAAEALRERYRGHDRVIVVTDEPLGHRPGDSWQAAPAPGPGAAGTGAPVYSWHLAGRRSVRVPEPGAPRHYAFDGLSDDAFLMVPLLERGERGDWPWQ
ncbi:vWA domain-containing protein [Streptomyces yaizuensis]|uniref:TROVE domain-containing protein n=1 Tax=Streptomyces yaizuensis TaxID=2989713 RepID=A0ABQ5P8Q4_9ACTN|nr:TROVE domain-containing protein [Streptomyces sp. YSPA8]GLF98646.1 TROVE domain-containing protein [Streptomyces sp. YSPA8]